LIEPALQHLETPHRSLDDKEAAIRNIEDYVFKCTHNAVYLPNDQTTDRIKHVMIKLLDEDSNELPTATLLWILGKVDDPLLKLHYIRWLPKLVTRLTSANAAIHNTLVNLDAICNDSRSSSIVEIEQNLERAKNYINKFLPTAK
jgi:hypothetical protein